MHEYERDVNEFRRMKRSISELREDLDDMIRDRDRGKEVRSGRIKKLSYYAMRNLSETYIGGVAVEAMRLEDVLGPADLEAAEEILDDIEDLIDEFAAEELDEEDDDMGDYYDYA
jgi:hypothetical protein